MFASEVLQLIANAATAVGVVAVAVQIWLATRQSKTEFEDRLSEEYRELMKDLPVDAFLGKQISVDGELLRHFFRYFDMTNTQIFLRQRKRIRRSTWNDWVEGIRDNLKLPAFVEAWRLISPQTTSFAELRELLRKDFPQNRA